MESIIEIALACILSTVLFAALIIYISKHPQKSTKPLKIIFVLMFISGMILYCYCHYQVLEKANQSGNPESSLFAWAKDAWASKILYISMRSVIDVGMMFYGRADSDTFYKLDEAKDPLYVCLFWLINVVSFCTAASALLIRFGNDLLRWIKIAQTKVSDIDLVYGVSPDSIAFGRNIAETKGRMLIYVDSIIGEDFEVSIRDMGGLSYSDKDALKATQSFLKEIRVRPLKTRLRLFALSYEYDNNLQYARMMSESLQKAGILPEQTELVLLGSDEWKGMMFQANEKQYGYGNVLSFNEYEMSARLLMHKYPPCNAINFDENGRATEDMNVLIVGFGHIGHEVLRKVISAGQFEGSNFHATIYDPNFEHRAGFIKSQYPRMFTNYDITFEPQGGRGRQIFRFLQAIASRLNYIVICIEDRNIARDIALHIVQRLQTIGYPKNVYTCDSKSVRCYSQYAQECETHWIYDSELLYSNALDRYAMEINHRYMEIARSNVRRINLTEDWKQCKYFERMSSRASVDYLIPLIRRIRKGNVSKIPSWQMENLAHSEHLRWCAFHYTFGYDVMDKEEFIHRLKNRQNEIREYGKSNIKAKKDEKTMRHVCLVDWDELDEISRIENSMILTNKNYENDCVLEDEKEALRRWVNMIQTLLQDEEQKE